ncbi:MAG: dihydrolipoyl dehydrogenase [Candidatus Izemoplasmatales bacterium]|nr:dihydrolipoyl dehydrogenase [Candidatus Izemoplasmatales bacterium]
MERIKTDLLIIGAGPGGYVAALYAQKKGLKVTLVEKEFIGGTCLNVGCIPTKSLVKSAHLYDDALHSEEYGITAKDVMIDMEKVISKKNFITKQLVDGISFLLNKYGVEVVFGNASFINDKEVLVTFRDKDIIYEPTDIIIATGASSRHLRIEGLDIDNVMDSTKLLDNDNLPKTLNIIGGGIIGMEFAFIYGKLGVEVNVIEYLPSILPTIDKDISQRLIRFAKMSHISIHTSAEVKKIEKLENGQARVHYLQKESTKFLDADIVLEAVGRAPNMDGLNLENTKVEFSRNGIKVNKYMKTNIAHIYAIGDVTNIMQLAHVASHQGICAVDHILGKDKEMSYLFIPSVIFTTPQIATSGASELDLIKSETPYHVFKVPFSANGKAVIMNNAFGFIKLLIENESSKVVGVAVFGDDAEHLIATLTVMIQNNLSPEQIKETVFAHPTTSELIHETALGLLNEAIHFVE